MRVTGRHLVPYSKDTVAGRVLLLAKDERLTQLTDFFAGELYQALVPFLETVDHSNFVVTYLPRGRYKAAVSGIDQGRALAKALGKRLNVPMVSLFQRRNSTAQKDLATAEERLRVARRSYRLRKRIPILAGKTVLMVDDIFTTGATMIAGAELLRAQGVETILCATVGKTDHPSK